MTIEQDQLPELLRLDPVAENRYAVANEGDPTTHNVVFGGQFLAQMIMAAAHHSPDKAIKTIHAVFARAGRVDAGTELEVDTFHAGRAFASHTITAWQGDRLCSRAQILTHAADPDFITHQTDRSRNDPPTDGVATRRDSAAFPGAEYVIADNVDLVSSTAPAGPAELSVWYRSPDTPDHPVVNQAVLAWATDGFLIGTAMRPHDGVGYDRAHVDVSTGVVGHTLTFHRPFSLQDWLLMQHEAPFAGEGRSYGRCHIHDAGGTLVASYVQDNMIRAMPEGMAHKRM